MAVFLRLQHCVVLVYRLLPLARESNKCSPTDFRDAFIELSITTIFSTLPIWFPWFWSSLIQSNLSFSDQLRGTIRGGELMVYCAALVGPLVFIISKRYGERRQEPGFPFVIAFPHGIEFVVGSALICIFASGGISALKFSVLTGYPIKLNEHGVIWTSACLYGVSLYFFFFASAYRNAMSSATAENGTSAIEKSQMLEEEKFTEEWEARSHAR
jgi:hypothetical protein